jgi:hypothetical protein
VQRNVANKALLMVSFTLRSKVAEERGAGCLGEVRYLKSI